jgi:hypothetical protein
MANMSNRFRAERDPPTDDDEDDENFNKLNLYFRLLPLVALNMFTLSLGFTLLLPIGTLAIERLLFVLLFFTLLRCSVVMVALGLPKLTTTTDCCLMVGEVEDDIELRSEAGGGTCCGLARFDEAVGLLIMLECC